MGHLRNLVKENRVCEQGYRYSSNGTLTQDKRPKLKAKKKYYVRVRTYKTVGGVKYYSPWSKVKKVKTR